MSVQSNRLLLDKSTRILRSIMNEGAYLDHPRQSNYSDLVDDERDVLRFDHTYFFTTDDVADFSKVLEKTPSDVSTMSALTSDSNEVDIEDEDDRTISQILSRPSIADAISGTMATVRRGINKISKVKRSVKWMYHSVFHRRYRRQQKIVYSRNHAHAEPIDEQRR